MKIKNQKKLRKDTDHSASRDNNNSLLLQKFARFVKLIRTDMAPKKNTTGESAMKTDTVTRSGRITRRRATIVSHVPDKVLIPKPPVNKVTHRQTFTTERSKICQKRTRSMQIITGNYFILIRTCDIRELKEDFRKNCVSLVYLYVVSG